MPIALVVDDSRTMREILVRTLAELGWESVAAPDGLRALHVLSEGLQPDVVVLDRVMPGLSGVELVRALREVSAVPVLVVTADSGFDGVQAALEAGADEYLMKPFTADALESKLALLGLVPA